MGSATNCAQLAKKQLTGANVEGQPANTRATNTDVWPKHWWAADCGTCVSWALPCLLYHIG